MKKIITDNLWLITLVLVIGVGYLVYTKYQANSDETETK